MSDLESEASWNTSINLGLLIEAVQRYEYLFNIKHKDYKNRAKKNHTWKEISKRLNTSVKECMRHWRNLRDRFTREKRSCRTGQIQESNWPYYEKMLFYEKFSKPRKYSLHRTRPSQGSREPSPVPSNTELSPWSSMEIIVSPSVIEAEEDNKRMVSEVIEKPMEPKEKKRKMDVNDELLSTAEKIAQTLMSVLDSGTPNSNRRFCDYVYSRLEEMTAEESKSKRKALIQILED